MFQSQNSKQDNLASKLFSDFYIYSYETTNLNILYNT